MRRVRRRKGQVRWNGRVKRRKGRVKRWAVVERALDINVGKQTATRLALAGRGESGQQEEGAGEEEEGVGQVARSGGRGR